LQGEAVLGPVICASLVTGLLLTAVPFRSAQAADSSTCDTLASQFEAKHAELGGASTAARDRNGGTALTHAARGGHEPLVRLLVGHGAEINRHNLQGSTPLYIAVEQNRLAAASALLELGADLNLPGRGGVTPLSAAAYNGNLKLVDLLLDRGADTTVRDVSGKTAILYAAARGFGPLVTRLLATGIDVNATYGNNLTVLMWAAGYADDVPVDDGVGVVTLLLDKGAAIEAKDDRGRTALMTAASLGHDEVGAVLLQRGADRTARDRDGKTAADLATSDALRAELGGAPAR
jgi:ankyrin repeat protein